MSSAFESLALSQCAPASVFERLADDLCQQGYSIIQQALPAPLVQDLWQQIQNIPEEAFNPAGIGRHAQHTHNGFVRSDSICWIDGNRPASQAWLQWAQRLQTYLNAQLFLGLQRFESHFAHYAPGDFYKTHRDAFQGQANRRLSLILYLNPGWRSRDGGQLQLFLDEHCQHSIEVLPHIGTLVTFLSEDFPHQVLPARRDRYSIAGWFRVDPLPLLDL